MSISEKGTEVSTEKEIEEYNIIKAEICFCHKKYSQQIARVADKYNYVDEVCWSFFRIVVLLQHRLAEITEMENLYNIHLLH